jgi:hypothetical protein
VKVVGDERLDQRAILVDVRLAGLFGDRDRIDCEDGFMVATSDAPRRLDRGDINLLHAHHRIKCALCFIAATG